MSQKSQEEEEIKRPPSPISEVPHGINVSSEPPGSGWGSSLSVAEGTGRTAGKEKPPKHEDLKEATKPRDEIPWGDTPVDEGRKHAEEHIKELEEKEKSGGYSKIKEEEQKLYGYGIEAQTPYTKPHPSD